MTRRSEPESDAKNTGLTGLLNVWWPYPRDSPLSDLCDVSFLLDPFSVGVFMIRVTDAGQRLCKLALTVFDALHATRCASIPRYP